VPFFTTKLVRAHIGRVFSSNWNQRQKERERDAYYTLTALRPHLTLPDLPCPSFADLLRRLLPPISSILHCTLPTAHCLLHTYLTSPHLPSFVPSLRHPDRSPRSSLSPPVSPPAHAPSSCAREYLFRFAVRLSFSPHLVVSACAPSRASCLRRLVSAPSFVERALWLPRATDLALHHRQPPSAIDACSPPFQARIFAKLPSSSWSEAHLDGDV
jgi:hypothetical protein